MTDARISSPDGIEPIAYTPDQAVRHTGRSRSRIFKAIREGELLARKDGRATLIEADELRRWIRSFPTVNGAAA
jgi:excisionase family DNA binding protein